MATAQDAINEWVADSKEKQDTQKAQSGLILRWLNEAQLRFADKSEILRDEWQPAITSTGNIALPANFIREYPDKVKKDAGSTVNPPLEKLDHVIATMASFSGTTHYSIHNGKFYVWSAAALTPSVIYVKKPALITALPTADLELPTEWHSSLIPFLESKWLYHTKKISYGDLLALLKNFDSMAQEEGTRFHWRRDGFTKMRATRF